MSPKHRWARVRVVPAGVEGTAPGDVEANVFVAPSD
jgi:hypothetical protein